MTTTLVENLPHITATGVIIKAVLILAIISALAGFGTFIERKVLAFMQRRLGPMHVGPYGILQIAADGIKLFTKEDIIPQNANSFIFKIAPVITAATAFIALSSVPVFPDFTIPELFRLPEWFPIFGGVMLGDVFVPSIASDLNIGILFVLGMMAAGLYGPLLAGMSQANKWGIIGASRTAVQFLSYEVVTGLSILAPIMLVGSLSFVDFNNYQMEEGVWMVVYQPVAFVLFLIAGFAETNRTPFDLLEHEAEVVSGYATEYSGMRWGMFFIGEYANMITISIITAVVFLGGYDSACTLGWLFMILKVAFTFFLMLWVRASWPHVRPDQLMWLCWKVLMPLAVVNILITATVVMLLN